MRRINDVVMALVDKWREFTFAGILRIEFPVAPTSPKTPVKYERAPFSLR